MTSSSTVRPRRRGSTDQTPPAADLAAPITNTAAADPTSPPDRLPTGSEMLRTTDLPSRSPAGPMPPAMRADTQAVAAAGWFYGQAITHLFSYNSPQGAWVFVNGPGWKRLSPASPHGVTHMITIATHDNLPVNYHEDAAGLIDQMYV